MSSLSDPKQVLARFENRGGLPLERFISTLEWACDSHGSPPSCGETASNCVVCKRQLHNSTFDSEGTDDHLEGLAVFQVTRLHRLAFSPLADSAVPLSRIRATLSVSDGLLRIALYFAPNRWRCLVLDTKKILEEPKIESTDKMLCLTLVFPFVSLSLERTREINQEVCEVQGESHVGELQFDAMRNAIIQLRNAHSNAGPHCATISGKMEKGSFVSLFEKRLEQVSQQIDTGEVELRDGLLNFLVRGSAMVMPLGFPHRPPQSKFEGLNVDQSEQVLFFEAFLDHEIFLQAAMEQAAAWVRKATRACQEVQDILVTKRETKQRQPQLLSQVRKES